MEILTESVSKEDLDLINAWTLEPLTAEQVFTFKAKLIDETPTSNGRIWSREWQSANAPKFVGVPITLNHDTTDARLVAGRIYRAEFAEADGATYGWGYIPVNTEYGRTAATEANSGKLKSMSINATAKKKKKQLKEDGTELDVILPSEDDRILEVSFVAVPGCAACGIVNESYPNVKSPSESLITFAESALKDLRNEYIRLARFALGDIKKSTYESVSESVDPLTLKALVEDLKRVLADKDKDSKQTEPTDDPESELTMRLRDKLQAIRKTKGV